MAHQRRGFTLAEVLIAITIVGIVAAISLTQYGATVQRARFDAARDVLLLIYSGEQTYYTLNESYKGGLTNATTTASMQAWRSIFMDNPNLPDPASGGALPVSYTVTAAPATFTATAEKNGGGTMTIDENRTIGGTGWSRLP